MTGKASSGWGFFASATVKLQWSEALVVEEVGRDLLPASSSLHWKLWVQSNCG